MRRVEIIKVFRFEAAHVLPKHPGKCSRLHGHSWLLRVGVMGFINPATGFVADYIDLKALVQPYIDQWDHSYLGALDLHLPPASTGDICLLVPPTFQGYPSSENLVEWLVRDLEPKVLTLPNLRPETGPGETPYLSLVEIEETCTSRCTWRPTNGHV